ncbi:MAG TPA: DUF4185 domain-containing protein [Ideonella sp.]|nr:DUF4185 domain-containing protein [Ideonella sp.]
MLPRVVPTRLGAALLGALACLAPALATAQAEPPPPIPPITSVVNLGLVQQNPYVNCRDGTYSALIKGKALWTFNDTCLSNGGVLGDQFIDNTLAWDGSLDASKGISLEHDLKDSQGVPVRFVPFTANEIAFTAEHQPNELAIWPGHIVPDPKRNRALVFFGTVYRGAKIGFRGIGGGIAVMSLKTREVTRPVQSLDPNAPEPTYLWQKGERQYSGGYLLDGDMLYNYGGEGVFLSTLIHVARVPLADALDKSKWRYYAGNSAGNSVWSESPDDSKSVYVGGAAGDTLFWSDYLGMYVTVFQPFLSNDVYYRVAHHPEGPWSEQALMFTAQQGTDPSYAARVHTAYAKNGGQVQYITYVKNTGFLSQELPLTQVTFGKPLAR